MSCTYILSKTKIELIIIYILYVDSCTYVTYMCFRVVYYNIPNILYYTIQGDSPSMFTSPNFFILIFEIRLISFSAIEMLIIKIIAVKNSFSKI